MDKFFSHLRGKSIEVYIDDMVVKSPDLVQYSTDLTDVFTALRRFNLQLNLEKRVFGVDVSKFLGFMLTQRKLTQKNVRQSLICEAPTMSRKYND